jgi:hypothetical protein
MELSFLKYKIMEMNEISVSHIHNTEERQKERVKLKLFVLI